MTYFYLSETCPKEVSWVSHQLFKLQARSFYAYLLRSVCRSVEKMSKIVKNKVSWLLMAYKCKVTLGSEGGGGVEEKEEEVEEEDEVEEEEEVEQKEEEEKKVAQE